MRIKEIEHVQLAMPPGKESEARTFYEGVLGIPEVPNPQSGEARVAGLFGAHKKFTWAWRMTSAPPGRATP